MKNNLFDKLKQRAAQKKEAHGENSFDFYKFGERLSRYFDAEPEKERVLRHEDFDAAGDTYYATVSARYKVGQRISLALLVLFLLLSVLFNIRSITFDNLFYLVKDLGAAADTKGTNYETLSYDAASDQSYALYRGGLFVVSRTNVSSFTSTGRRTLNTSASYSNPIPVSSGKYLFVYDMGDSGFDVYNSFAKIFSEKTDYPIFDIVFSEKGTFAVLSRSEEHLSTVTVYDADFNKLAAYKRDLYAIDISIDKNGERLGAVYVGTIDGIVSTHVVIYDLKKQEKLEEYVYEDEFPLGCTFLDGGGFSVISDATLRVYDRRLSEKYVSEKHDQRSVAAIYTDKEYCAVAINDGVITDLNEVMVFNKNGDLVYDEMVLSGVEQIAVCRGYLFLKNSDGVLRIGLKNNSLSRLPSGNGKMLIYDESTVMVCLPSKAEYLNFGK